MTPPEQHDVALGLERLNGTMEAGFARLDGRLDVLLQRTDRAEEDVKQLREDHDQDIADLRGEVEELKRNRWPVQAVTAVTAAGALGVAVWQAVGQ
ncbi:hypothetical protein [Streptomyces sp. NPDC002845]